MESEDWHEQAESVNVTALLLLPLLCVTGLVGNLMVCVAIGMDRRLQNVTNYFLFSLALADLLVCTVVMPLAILVEFQHGLWRWSFTLCLVYTYADVFLCSASIVHISVISLDRYLGISRPLKNRNKSRSVVAFKIFFVWVITIIISSPLAVLAFKDPDTILRDNVCTIRSQHYMIYGSVLAFLIPFIIMTITFTKTTHLLNKQANKLSHKPVDDIEQGLRRTIMSKKGAPKTQKPQQKEKQEVPSIKLRRTGSAQSIEEIPSPIAEEPQSDGRDNAGQETNGQVTPDEQCELHCREEHALSRNRLERQSTYLRSQMGKIRTQLHQIRRKHQSLTASAELANEHKASRVLAIVFACFFTCWTPFFIMNFTLGFCGLHCSVPPSIASVILWLGYLSSTLNPVIYTIFNRRFREAFIKILKGRCCSIRESAYTRSQVCLTGDATW